MSVKQFFINRYAQLGWDFSEINIRPSIRINQVNAKGKKLPERLRKLGVLIEKIPFLSSGYWVKKSKVSIGSTIEYLLGMYSIQEAAAQIPVSLFDQVKGRIILDACAAPGGKTVELADLMENGGIIIALDINQQRLSVMANHLERCHVSNTAVYNIDARQAAELKRVYDCILLDVPCSGNFASDNKWFNRRKLDDIKRNAMIQREILASAAKCLAKNGEMVYSTCSLEPEEDELNMDWAVKNLGLEIQKINCIGTQGLSEVFGQRLHPSVANCRRIWPNETQGFFLCKLGRRS